MTKVWNDEFHEIPIVEQPGLPENEVRLGYPLRVSRNQLDAIYNKVLSDFTRVVEETGVLDQGRSQKETSRWTMNHVLS